MLVIKPVGFSVVVINVGVDGVVVVLLFITPGHDSVPFSVT